jgi:hypothetical protein
MQRCHREQSEGSLHLLRFADPILQFLPAAHCHETCQLAQTLAQQLQTAGRIQNLTILALTSDADPFTIAAFSACFSSVIISDPSRRHLSRISRSIV